uniref:CXXC repeat containing interactor of PDZ3 domain n=1 Tax=Pipistrellus kuhlii TaxID=59472 RepID=A0A7J7VTX5_PIPKU|nr:CXXC repeat containing interactor of PDZ3 domain [Pipistrellus kuhlii]
MERISSPLAEFAKVLCTNRALITARAVRTKRVSVQCVGKKCWIPKTTSKRLSRCIDEDSVFLYDFAFYFKFSRHITDVQVIK